MVDRCGPREDESGYDAVSPVPADEPTTGADSRIDLAPSVGPGRLRLDGRPSMIPRRILVLEDNLIIAMEAEDIFSSLGTEEIHIASNLSQATALLDSQTVDFALLDVNLGAAMSFDFARLLLQRGIPFGFSSGYSDSGGFPEDLQQVSLLRKPFGEDAVRKLLADVFKTAP